MNFVKLVTNCQNGTEWPILLVPTDNYGYKDFGAFKVYLNRCSKNLWGGRVCEGRCMNLHA